MAETSQTELKRLKKEEEKTVKDTTLEAAPAKAVEAPKATKTEEKEKEKPKKKEPEAEKPTEEKVVIISLSEAWKTPRNQRAADASHRLKMIAEKNFHKKAFVSMELNNMVWTRGMHNPPSRIKVKVSVFKDRVMLSPAQG